MRSHSNPQNVFNMIMGFDVGIKMLPYFIDNPDIAYYVTVGILFIPYSWLR